MLKWNLVDDLVVKCDNCMLRGQPVANYFGQQLHEMNAIQELLVLQNLPPSSDGCLKLFLPK